MSLDDRDGASVVRVLLADDQHLVRAGFRLVLERDECIQVVGEAADGAAAGPAPVGSYSRKSNPTNCARRCT